MARTPDFDEGPDFVQSLARGLQVLRAFDHSLPQANLSEISERTSGLPLLLSRGAET